MTERAQYIASLVSKRLKDELSAAETQDLEAWIQESAANRELFESILQQETVVEALTSFYSYDNKNIALKIEREIPGLDLELKENANELTPVRNIHPFKTAWLRYAAAIVLVIGACAYLYYNLNRISSRKEDQLTLETTDIPAPSSMHATITLSNGKTIMLDSTATGLLAREGEVIIEKTSDGKIIYRGLAEDKVLYNTIAVPRGSKIASVVMSDGTTVFLNTASSLTYPVAFTGNERRVSVNGEAYFEVAKNKDKKFIVESNGITTEVLGTHFNVNTYNDETIKTVTLLEGSVKVSKNDRQFLLHPGQQAAISANDTRLYPGVDTSSVMGWKNGVFEFNKTPLKDAMRQLARWYDLEIVYKAQPAISFGGSMGRDLSLQQVLKLLAGMGLQYKLEGKVLEIR